RAASASAPGPPISLARTRASSVAESAPGSSLASRLIARAYAALHRSIRRPLAWAAALASSATFRARRWSPRAAAFTQISPRHATSYGAAITRISARARSRSVACSSNRPVRPRGSLDAQTAYERISRSPVSRATAMASSNWRSDSAMSSRIVTEDALHTKRRTSSALGPSVRAASIATSSSFTAAKSESSRSFTMAPSARAEASSAGGTAPPVATTSARSFSSRDARNSPRADALAALRERSVKARRPRSFAPAASTSRDEPATFRLRDIAGGRRSRQRIEPEVAADDARFVQKSLDAGCRRVDSRSDNAVQCRRNDRVRPLIDEHVNVLLDEERVSLGPCDDLVDRPVGATREESAHELLGLRDVERLERDRHRVRASRTPARSSLEEVGPSKAKKQQRCMQLIEQLLEQCEERLFRPVEILEDDRSRCGAQPSLEVSR